MTIAVAEHEVEAFLRVAPDFRLGALVTEKPHPATRELSRLAREDLRGAIAALKAVDLAALARLEGHAASLAPLAEAVAETLARGHRIFLCGCGATGRLSISLELFGRDGLLGEPLGDRIIGFMAGGDAALVRSIERFEDFPEYGARQLRGLGFRDGDLLIATTEGGETPFVIGATEEAARLSTWNKPFFLYCNPDEYLCEVAERSRRVIEHPGIEKINLTVGPMAITGSTRMQASTVLMAAVGWAIACRGEARPAARLTALAREFREWVATSDFAFLAAFIEAEAAGSERGEFVWYEPGKVFGITVLTDTTERSPTFSLAPFENFERETDGEVPSLCYLHLAGTKTAGEAWGQLLGRAPRTLAWGGLDHLTGEEAMMGFDFSERMTQRREAALGHHSVFRMEHRAEAVCLELDALRAAVPAAGRDLFSRHLMLKLLLNTHSTLVMGRLGRYEGNVMTYVSPTNNKLIDRAIRYVRLLLEVRHGLRPSYEKTARALFEQKETLQRNEAIVMKTVAAMAGRSEAVV